MNDIVRDSEIQLFKILKHITDDYCKRIDIYTSELQDSINYAELAMNLATTIKFLEDDVVPESVSLTPPGMGGNDLPPIFIDGMGDFED